MGNIFSWHYNDLVVYKDQLICPEEYNFQLVHSFYMPDMEVGYQSIRSEHFSILFPILKKLPIKALWRVKGNMIPRQDQYLIHGYHVDIPFYDYPTYGDYTWKHFKSTTAVFYVNTNNGHTVFEDGTKVDSVENRITIFDSKELHSGTTCTDSKTRVSININYF